MSGLHKNLFLALVIIHTVSGFTPDFILTQLSQLPIFPADAQLEVFYLESPLLQPSLGNTMAYLDGFHAGIGFRYAPPTSTTVQTLMLEYYAEEGMLSAVVPQISNNDLVWHNKIVIGYNTTFDDTYWVKASSMGLIRGSHFNAIRCFLLDYIEKQPAYQLWNVVVGPTPGELVVGSSTCVDFVWAVFGALTNAGAQLRPALPTTIRLDSVSFYIRPPLTTVNMSTPQGHQEVLLYYRTIQKVIAASSNLTSANEILLSELIFRLLTEGNSTIVVYDGKAYRKGILIPPYVTFAYTTRPFPQISLSACPASPAGGDGDQPDHHGGGKVIVAGVVAGLGGLVLGVLATWLSYRKQMFCFARRSKGSPMLGGMSVN
eukprot:TRINITY_DN1242_c0_g1_i4.p1 TRINITY_DN1242_c0_g1~~TRINITY_DN1242_c0_g1_i4.p1  ORF type:complete len:374 (-),score=53.01 TRINITY_DN1242_c0_g1_i4:3-1124(-)